ncbi:MULTISPECIES: AsmA-like C-terminal region-containing protein [Pontibacter]|uniref:AsmA-like C-terminal region-containing protein n=1 Tax=Pontibacter TaxID=323449 RepID=UPI0020281585|nr:MULTISPECIES: AsmA-like C-terminal region-containing protein [Pontibacter]
MAAVVAVVTIAFALVYTYQDKIIALFVTEANKHIKTKVEVGTISLSLLDKFPQVAVSLDKVNVVEAVPESAEPLAKLSKLYFTFSIWDVLRGKYNVNELYLEDGAIFVKVLKDGSVNYEIIKTDTTATANNDFAFNLEQIELNRVAIHYTDLKLNQAYEVDAHQLQAALAIDPEAIGIEAKGDATINTIKLSSGEYFKGKRVTLNAALAIDRINKSITLDPSVVNVENAAYEVAGRINFAETTELDLKLNGKNTSIQSLLSLLPQHITKEFNQYRSDGDVYFSGSVKGKISAKHNPEITFSFGCRNATFYHPDVKQRLEKLSFEGSFTNGTNQNASTSALVLKNLKGSLNNRTFTGNVSYKNFKNPTVAFDARGMVDVAYVLGLLQLKQVRSGSGLADVQIAFSGNFNEFKERPGNSTLHTSGDITLHNVSLHLADLPLPITGMYGNFMFKRNDVAVSNFKGKLGESDFALNGMFNNVMAWLLLKNQRLLVDADFSSYNLNFDQLLREELNTPASARESNSGYRLEVSPDIAFNLEASVRKMKFRRFKGENIKGAVTLRNQVITTPNISFNAMGGNFAVRGSIDARQRNHIKVSTASKINHMSVDSLFYVFENFNQDFILDRHLRGSLTANIISDVYLDNQLNPKTNLLEAEIEATVRNGQLINFAPMQKMSTFVKRSELANMRFSELHNNFYIQQRTIYIPEMDIRTNLSPLPSVSISGMHTFDQDMDYKIKMPLFQKRRPDKDAVFGVVAEDTDAGNSMLFLTLKGKENNFKLAYDDERVRAKIKDDLKQEGQEIKQILKGKKPVKKEKTVELEEGEYFDFN